MAQKFSPRYIKGSATAVLVSRACWIGGGVLTAGGAAASLSIHNAATSASLNSSSTRRALVKVAASLSALIPGEGSPWYLATGCAVSLSAGSVAMILTSEGQRQ